MALAKWLRSRGHDPEIRDFWKRAEQAQDAEASRADQDTAAGLRRDAA
jgi:glutamyl-tRNA reductase